MTVRGCAGAFSLAVFLRLPIHRVLPMSRVDRVLRWVWLINGVLLLLLLAGSLVFVAIGALSGMGGGGSPSSALKPDSAGGATPASIRYDLPVAVRGTEARLVLERRGSGYVYSSTASSAPAGGEGPVVNVAFLDAHGTRLLLDRPAFIRRVRYPGHASEAPVDSALRWIVYEMALKDTNADGAVDDRDRRSLYVTALDGSGLRQVLPDGFEIRDWAPQPDGSLIATGLALAPEGGGMRQQAFVLDAAGAVKPYAALDSAAVAAGRIAGPR